MAQRRILELFEQDPAGSHLYSRLLREAAITDRVVSVAGQTASLKRGQLVFGLNQWASKTGLSEKVIRRVLKQLEEVGELGRVTHSKYSIISVLSMTDGQAEGRQKAGTGPAQGNSNNKEQRKEKKEGTDKDLVACAPKKVAQVLDWSPLNLTPEHQEDVKAIRAKHGKKGAISQRVINTLGKEFEQARSGGLSDEQIIGEWDTRGWVAIKAEWLLKDRQPARAASPALQNRLYHFPPASQEDVDFANDYLRNAL